MSESLDKPEDQPGRGRGDALRARAADRSRNIAGPLAAIPGALVVAYMSISGYLSMSDLVLNVFFLSGLAVSPFIPQSPVWARGHAIYIVSTGILLFTSSALGTNGVLSSGLPILVVMQLAAGVYLGGKGLRIVTGLLLAFSALLVAKFLYLPSEAELAAPVAKVYGRVFMITTAFLATHWICLRYVMEQVRLVESLNVANEHKSAFLANMSHEIRTPLNGILGIAQVMRDGQLTAETRSQVETILDSGRSLTTILNDVLDLSKVEAGEVELHPEPSNLGEAMRSVEDLWIPTAREKGIDLWFEIEESVPPLLVLDPVRVRQCVTNLVSNALKFTSEGQVTVTVSAHAETTDDLWVQVQVADTGMGMDEETRENLFRPFRQGDVSKTRETGGTGLGLTISRRLARLMGGDIHVHSAPGQGSTFTLGFRSRPALGEDFSTSEPGEPEPVDGPSIRGKRVLVVDDVITNRVIVRAFLEGEGAKVNEAENGAEALEALACAEFDLVLMDWHMPIMDGVTACQRIRASSESWKTVPIISLTADVMTSTPDNLGMIGMDGLIAKPIERETMMAEIRRVLRRAPRRDTGRDSASTAL